MPDHARPRPAPRGAVARRRLSAVVLSLALAASALAADPAPRRFDVPAGDAIDTLKRAAQQAGSEIMFPAQSVQGVRTNPVQGELTVREALDRMVAGTPLVVVQDQKTGALTVTRRAAPPAAENRPPAPAPSTRTDDGDGVVKLPAFAVSSERDVSYVGREALSTTRTGVELLDLPQSVKVINRALLDDLSPGLVVDVLKYVGGGQAGNINFADDRFTMRGFNSPADIGDFVDGFRAKVDSNTDLAIIERMEIIKGPSAIFVANGPVGGVINKVTKGPVSYDVRSVKLSAGLFDANRAEFDFGGKLTADGKWLYRFVAAAQDADGWYDRTYARRLIVAPSVSYVFSGDSRLTLKYFFFKYRFSSYNGLPWDERTGRRLAIARDSHFGEPEPLNWRKDDVHRGLLEYTNRFNEHLAMRLAGFVTSNHAARVESVNGASIPATFVNGTLVNRSTTIQDRHHYRRHVQADLVGTFTTGTVGHRLLAGTEWSDAPDIVAGFAGTSSAIDPYNLRFPGTVTVGAAPSSKLRTNNRQQKVFALETADFFDDRLLLSVGGSRVKARTSSKNQLTGTSTAPLSLTESLLQYGVVFKATPHVSLFYGYNENFAPNFLSGQVLPSQLGKQRELGLKGEILEGRLSFNLAWFDISQRNVPVLSFPQTNPPTFVLVPGQSSKGVDGDFTFSATKNLDFILTFASLDAQARSQANSAAPMIVNPVNNVAETTWGLWTRYKFATGELKGFTVGVGASHLAKRAVATNNNATVYGYLDDFTLVDLSLGYERDRIRYGLNVDNVFNTKYDAAVRNQSIIVPGMGLNVKASVMYKF